MEKELIENDNYYIIKFRKDEIQSEWIAPNGKLRFLLDNTKPFYKDLSTIQELNNKIILIKQYFKRMSGECATALYSLLSISGKEHNNIHIKQITNKSVAFLQYNMSKFNKDGFLKEEHIIILKRDILKMTE
jgi:hypothetical protein